MLSFAAVVACTQEQLTTPKLDVDKTEVSLEAVAGEATINVTSNVKWQASCDADWVSIDPSSGKGASKAVAVKVTADDNTSEQARTATVIIEAGDLEKTVKVSQAGKSEEPGPGPEPEPEYTLDGKQWVFTWAAMSVEAVADLGVTQEGTIMLAVDGSSMGMTGYVPYITGTYEVKPVDATSGVIEFVDPADPSATKVSISYKDLTETTVKFTLEAFGLVDVEAVAAAEKIEIGTGEPEPEPEVKTYLLVGDALSCGWDPANGIVLTLTDGYYVAKGVEIAAKKGMHFTLNTSWEGSVKGKEGLIRPNTIGEVGNNDISLTEGGQFDVYFAETLDKFYFMSEGKLPSEATEHEPIEVSWGVCGALVGNSWGTSDDPVLTKEGEWYVAKGIQFESEINFKVRGNNSWADDVKWGVAVQDQVCSLNSAIAVSTCTEFKAANSGAGDNPNIFIAAPVGEYDIYFSLEKKEVWVMNPGLKPGDDAPVVEETYTVTGTMTDNQWNNNGAIGLMTLEGDYYVAKNLPFVWSSSLYEDSNVDAMEFKICKTGTWDAYGMTEGAPYQSANAEIAVTYGGGNIVVSAPAGTYDVYFDKANGKLWVMTAGLKPGESGPQPAASEWSLVGSFNNWTPSAGLDLVEHDAEYYVYKGFAMESSTEFKFVKNKQWGGDMGGNGRIEPNTIQPTGGSNVSVTEPGTYDVFLAKSLDKFYVMTPGKTPADAKDPTPVDPSTFTWGMMGCFVDNQWTSDVPMTKEGEWLVAKNAQFTELTFKIRANESWADATNIGFAPGSEKGETNKAVTVVTAEYSKANLGGDAADIKLNGEAGVYDVYFNYDKLELWVMTPGTKPGETPAANTVDGKQWMFSWDGMGMPIPAVADLGVTEPGVFVFAIDGAVMGQPGYMPYLTGLYEVKPADATSGIIEVVDPNDPSQTKIPISYSELTATSVKITQESFGIANVVANLSPEFIDLMGGGSEPQPLPFEASTEFTGKIPAAGGTFTIKVEGEAAWAADLSKIKVEGFTLSATEGTGNAEITVTVPANTTYEERSFRFWIYSDDYVAVEDYEFEVTQECETPELAIGDFKSQWPFVCETNNAAGGREYTFANGSTVNGGEATGVKLGTGSYAGVFASQPVNVDGDNELSFYAAAWKGKTATLFVRVDGGAPVSFTLRAEETVTGSEPYSVTLYESDKYTLSLPGLKKESVIEFSTDESFTAVSNNSSGRAVIVGIKLANAPADKEVVEPTPSETITIPELNAAATSSKVAISTEKNYTLNAVVCGVSQNSSFGTVYVMTKGSAEAGNGIALYDSTLDGAFKVGDEIEVTLTANAAMLSKYNENPQISGVKKADIKVLSSGNTVTPVVVTPDQLINYLGMPVVVENATVAADGVWCTASSHGSHKFTANSTEFTVYVNKRAAVFNDVPYYAATGNISGIAVTYKGSLQLAPCDLKDVEAFATPAGGQEPEEPENPSKVLAEWLFTEAAMNDAATGYVNTFGTLDGVLDKTAGDGGLYVNANAAGNGKITYVQVDKTELDTGNKAERIVGGTGHPYAIGCWVGDYWLFEAESASSLPAGTKVNISFITRTSKTGMKYWRLEYLEGGEWKPAMATTTATVNGAETAYNIAMNADGSTNVEVDATVTLAAASDKVQFRMLCVANDQANGKGAITAPNGGTCRIASAADKTGADSPVIKVVE